MLGHRLRRWLNIETASGGDPVFAGTGRSTFRGNLPQTRSQVKIECRVLFEGVRVQWRLFFDSGPIVLKIPAASQQHCTLIN